MHLFRKVAGLPPFRPVQGHEASPSFNVSDVEDVKAKWGELEASRTDSVRRTRLEVVCRKFCQVFDGDAPPDKLKSAIDHCVDPPAFVTALSTRLVDSIGKATKGQATARHAAQSVMGMLQGPVDDEPCGPELLHALFIMRAELGGTPHLSKTNITSTLVKTTVLLFELPAPSQDHPARQTVEKRLVSVLCALCSHPSPIQELLETNTLGFLMKAAIADERLEQMGLRTDSIAVLKALFAAHIPDATHHHLRLLLQGKGVLRAMMQALDRKKTTLPADYAVEMLEALSLCVTQSCAYSDGVLLEFVQFKGYFLLEEYALWLDHRQGQIPLVHPQQHANHDAVVEALVSRIVDIVFELCFLVFDADSPKQARFALRSFGRRRTQMEEAGGTATNLEAFTVLHNLFLGASRSPVKELVIRKVLILFSMSPGNYDALRGRHTVASFINILDSLDNDLQDAVIKLLEFTSTSSDKREALQELSALVCLLQTRLQGRTLERVSATVVKLVRFDPRFAELFQQVGLLDVIISHMKAFVIQQKSNTTPRKSLKARARRNSAGLIALPSGELANQPAVAPIAEEPDDEEDADGDEWLKDQGRAEAKSPSEGFSFDNMAFEGMELDQHPAANQAPVRKTMAKELQQGQFTLITEERFWSIWDMCTVLLVSSPENVGLFRENNGQSILIKMMEVKLSRKGALRLLEMLVEKEESRSVDDVVAFLELLQGANEDKVGLRLDLLGCLVRMFETDLVRNTFRENGGFESCVAALAKLESAPSGHGAHHELFVALVTTVTAALQDHDANRQYVKSGAFFKSLGDALQLAAVMDKFNPTSVCNALLDLAVEFVHKTEPGRSVSPRDELLRIANRNVSPTPVLHHPEAVSLLLSMLSACEDKLTMSVVAAVLGIAEDHPVNLAALASVGTVQHILESFSSPLLEADHPLHQSMVNFLSVVGGYSLSPFECRLLFQLVLQHDEANEDLLDVLGAMAQESHSGPFFQFKTQRARSEGNGPDVHQSSLVMSQLGSKVWGPSTGFSFGSWVRVDAVSEGASVPLMSLRYGNSKDCSVMSLESGLRRVKWENPHDEVAFDVKGLGIRKWFHVCLVHSRQRLGMGATVTLVVNGEPVKSEKVAYSAHTNQQVECIIGASPQVAADDVTWRMAAVFVFGEPIPLNIPLAMCLVGRAYCGLFQSSSKELFSPDVFERALEMCGNSAQSLLDSRDALPNMDIAIHEDKVVAVYSPHAVQRGDDGRVFVRNLAAETGHPRARLCNVGHHTPMGLADNIRKVGGVSIALHLLQRARTKRSVSTCLQFLGALLYHNPKNHRDMERVHGYDIVAHSLREHAQRDNVDTRVVSAVCDLVTNNPSIETSLVANARAFDTVILDFEIWESVPLQLQKYLLHRIVGWVAGNRYHAFNVLRMDKMRVVEAMLDVLANDNVDLELVPSAVDVIRLFLENSMELPLISVVVSFLLDALFDPVGTPSFNRNRRATLSDRVMKFSLRLPASVRSRRRSPAAQHATPPGEHRGPGFYSRRALIAHALLQMLATIVLESDAQQEVLFNLHAQPWVLVLLSPAVDGGVFALAAKILCHLLRSRAAFADKFRSTYHGFTIFQNAARHHHAHRDVCVSLLSLLLGQTIEPRALSAMAPQLELAALQQLFNVDGPGSSAVSVVFPEALSVLLTVMAAPTKSNPESRSQSPERGERAGQLSVPQSEPLRRRSTSVDLPVRAITHVTPIALEIGESDGEDEGQHSGEEEQRKDERLSGRNDESSRGRTTSLVDCPSSPSLLSCSAPSEYSEGDGSPSAVVRGSPRAMDPLRLEDDRGLGLAWAAMPSFDARVVNVAAHAKNVHTTVQFLRFLLDNESAYQAFLDPKVQETLCAVVFSYRESNQGARSRVLVPAKMMPDELDPLVSQDCFSEEAQVFFELITCLLAHVHRREAKADVVVEALCNAAPSAVPTDHVLRFQHKVVMGLVVHFSELVDTKPGLDFNAHPRLAFNLSKLCVAACDMMLQSQHYYPSGDKLVFEFVVKLMRALDPDGSVANSRAPKSDTTMAHIFSACNRLTVHLLSKSREHPHNTLFVLRQLHSNSAHMLGTASAGDDTLKCVCYHLGRLLRPPRRQSAASSVPRLLLTLPPPSPLRDRPRDVRGNANREGDGEGGGGERGQGIPEESVGDEGGAGDNEGEQVPSEGVQGGEEGGAQERQSHEEEKEEGGDEEEGGVGGEGKPGEDEGKGREDSAKGDDLWEEVRMATLAVWKILIHSRDATVREFLAQPSGVGNVTDLTGGFYLLLKDYAEFDRWYRDMSVEVDRVLGESVGQAWLDFDARVRALKQDHHRQVLAANEERVKKNDKRKLVEREALRIYSEQSHKAIVEAQDKWKAWQSTKKQALLSKNKFAQEQSSNLVNSLVRERAICGRMEPSSLQVWELDNTEGPMRMRLRMLPQHGHGGAQSPRRLAMDPVHAVQQGDPDLSHALPHALPLADKPSPELQIDDEDGSVDDGSSRSSGAARESRSRNASGGSELGELGAEAQGGGLPQPEAAPSPSTPRTSPQQSPSHPPSESGESESLAPGRSASGRKLEDAAEQVPPTPLEERGLDKLHKWLDPDERVLHRENCKRVTGLSSVSGVFLLCSSHCYFIEAIHITEEGTVEFENNVDDGEEQHDQCLKWAYRDICEIHQRRFLLRSVAMELFATNGLNHLLVFEPGRRDLLFSRFSALASKPELVTSQFQSTKAHAMSKEWKLGKMSNFDFLMQLNSLAGRSYNDYTQYPVFPWVLADYTSEELDLNDPHTFRDFSKPMGAQNERRLELFVKRFEEWEDSSVPPFHYGTHYSVAGSVVYYLIRLEPFTSANIALQGTGRFDHSDRLFHSIRDSWESASGHGSKAQMSDVKELIPEFFYLPDFLLNRNKLELGRMQTGAKVDDVVLPPWAKGDAREFIRIHREALESPYVTAHLHEWIDLVFGFKQQGKEAVQCHNMFYYLTYEGAVNVDAIEDELSRRATIAQITHFGQTPQQLFKRPHKGITVPLPVHTCRSHPELLQAHLHAERAVDDGVYETRLVASRPVFVGANKRLLPPDFSRFLSWDRYDPSLRMFAGDLSNRKEAVFENLHDGPITAVAVSDCGQLIATGGEDTLVCLWRLVPPRGKGRAELKLLSSLCAHVEHVSAIHVSSAFSIVVSGGAQGSCVVWDLNRLRLVQQLPSHGHAISHIRVDKLTGNIVTSAGTKLFVWTINGEALACVDSIQYGLERCRITALACADGYTASQTVFTGHGDGAIKLWRLVHVEGGKYKLEQCALWRTHTKAVTSIAMDGSSNRMFSADSSGAVQMWTIPESK